MTINNENDLEKILIKTLKELNGDYVSKEELFEILDVDVSYDVYDRLFDNLKREFEIVMNPYDHKKFTYVNNSVDTRKGIIRIRKDNSGYVVSGKDRFFVNEEDLYGAKHNDTIIMRFVNKKKRIKDKARGYVISVIKNVTLTGEVVLINDKKVLIDYMTKIPVPNMEEVVKDLEVGTIGLFKLRPKGTTMEGEYVKYITSDKSLNKTIEILAATHGYFKEFGEEVDLELKDIPDKVLDSDLVGRMDFRDVTTFTIDGESTKDFDDAISIYRKGNGNTVLMVHIAAVNNYVKNGTHIDLEAFNRAFSFYPPGDVVPMLPKKLSDGICSLSPGEDRLTNSVIMEFNKQGINTSFHIVPSVIRSDMKMIYEEINEKFENPDSHYEYDKYLDELNLLQNLTNKFNKNAKAKGRLDINDTEIKFRLDENLEPIAIDDRQRGVSERMIEHSMIATNEIVNRFFKEYEIPCINRVHNSMKTTKFDKFIEVCDILELNLDIDERMKDYEILQSALDQIKDHEHKDLLTPLLIRTLSKASYSSGENRRHFGLASNGYTHFTSPIRRYPDLFIHRYLDEVYFHSKDANIADEIWLDKFKADKIPVTKIGNIEKDKKFNVEKLEKIAESVSKQANSMKDKNDQISRTSDNIYIAKYINNFHVNDIALGKIAEVNDSKLLIKLVDKPIFGKAEYNNDFEFYNETYKIGEKVEVLIEEADEEKGEVHFSLVKKKKGDKFGNKQ